MGEKQNGPFQLSFNASLKIDFQGSRITSDGGLILVPVVWYKGFLYQAASWKTARRVVAKVEFHFGELFPRVGFIVTNLGNGAAVRWCGSTTSAGRRRSGSRRASRRRR